VTKNLHQVGIRGWVQNKPLSQKLSNKLMTYDTAAAAVYTIIFLTCAYLFCKNVL
jgi:hypothetical protein